MYLLGWQSSLRHGRPATKFTASVTLDFGVPALRDSCEPGWVFGVQPAHVYVHVRAEEGSPENLLR